MILIAVLVTIGTIFILGLLAGATIQRNHNDTRRRHARKVRPL